MLCYVMLRYVTLCYAMLYYIMLYYIIYKGPLFLCRGQFVVLCRSFQDWRYLLQRIQLAEKRGIYSEESPGSFAGQARIQGRYTDVHRINRINVCGLKPVVNCWDKLVVCVYGESRWGDLIVMPDKGPTKRALPHAEPSFSSGRTVGASSLSHPAAWHRSIPSRVCLDNWTSESTASGMFWKTGPIGFGRNTIQSCCFNVTLLFI